jgi:hypothetical protein
MSLIIISESVKAGHRPNDLLRRRFLAAFRAHDGQAGETSKASLNSLDLARPHIGHRIPKSLQLAHFDNFRMRAKYE